MIKITLLIRFCQIHPKNCLKDDNRLLKSQNLRLRVLICIQGLTILIFYAAIDNYGKDGGPGVV